MIKLLFTGVFSIILVFAGERSFCQYPAPGDEPVVIQIVQLDHADAEELAEVLRPFLTRDGSISAYGPANSLIIKDRKSVVLELLKVIKGRPGRKGSPE
jgi:type II secretory pathway component GspD/PulD (secretin)